MGVLNYLWSLNMIAFDLLCTNGHLFECWFKDSDSFEEQKSEGIITCPVCNDHQVVRAYSPFMIKKNHGENRKKEIDPYQISQMIHDFLEKNFEEVGNHFAKEALKIHYGEAEERNIKGTATPEEEVILEAEGAQFFKVPTIKRMLN